MARTKKRYTIDGYKLQALGANGWTLRVFSGWSGHDGTWYADFTKDKWGEWTVTYFKLTPAEASAGAVPNKRKVTHPHLYLCLRAFLRAAKLPKIGPEGAPKKNARAIVKVQPLLKMPAPMQIELKKVAEKPKKTVKNQKAKPSSVRLKREDAPWGF